MPNIESAIKRVRTSANANAKNSSQTNAMRTAIKKFEEAVAAGADNVDALYNEAVKAVDMAATKGLIHKNKANRDKIRLSKLAKYCEIEVSIHVSFFFHPKMSKSVFTKTRTFFYKGESIHGKSVVRC